jgi:uncharacterized protein YpmB
MQTELSVETISYMRIGRERDWAIWEIRYDYPKRRFTQKLHGATSHKTAFFIVTDVKTSYLTRLFIIIIIIIIIYLFIYYNWVCTRWQ